MRKKKTIELAPRTRLESVEFLAPRFFHEVIGMEYEDCLVTDESDLRDFLEVGERDLGPFLRRFQEHYFLDPAAAGSTRVVALLEYLQANGASA